MNFKKIVFALAAIVIAIGVAQYMGMAQPTATSSDVSASAEQAAKSLNDAAAQSTAAANQLAQETTAAINNAISSNSSSNIVATAAANSSFKTFTSLVAAAGLSETLSGPGPFTVFAPSDAAFAKLPAETLASLQRPENKAQLQQILSYHVVSGKLASSEWSGKTASPQSVAGLNLSIDGSSNTINGAKIASDSITASNGVIYSIDTVLQPNSASSLTN
jgi:uncharacterized surface protein with fasciclin (FAS1) repeats